MSPMSSGYDLADRVRPDGGCSIRNLKRYIRDGKLAADLEVPFEDNSSFEILRKKQSRNRNEKAWWLRINRVFSVRMGIQIRMLKEISL